MRNSVGDVGGGTRVSLPQMMSVLDDGYERRVLLSRDSSGATRGEMEPKRPEETGSTAGRDRLRLGKTGADMCRRAAPLTPRHRRQILQGCRDASLPVENE